MYFSFAFLFLPLVQTAIAIEACCFNGSEIPNQKLCNFLESSGEYVKDPCVCSLSTCNLTRYDSESFSEPSTLEACWNSDTELYSVAQLCCDDLCTLLWAFNSSAQASACCYVADGQPTCAPGNLSPLTCAQFYQGVPADSCSLCGGAGACLTGVDACRDTSLLGCNLQPLAFGGSALSTYQGLGGWNSSLACSELAVVEVVWEFFGTADCTGPSVVAGRRGHGSSLQDMLVLWNVSLTYDSLPLWWYLPGSPVLPLECVSLAGGPSTVLVAGEPSLSARFRPQIAIWRLNFPYIVSTLLVVAFLTLGLALVAERRWRFLRSHGQPTASLLRGVAIVCWLNFLRCLLLPVLLRHDFASWVVIFLWALVAVVAVATDLAFWVFIALFAKHVQRERSSYTKERQRTRHFLVTQVLPPFVLVLASFGIIIIAITGHYRKLLDGPSGVSILVSGTIALNMAPAYVAMRLAFLVRYTMRVLPFRSTKLLALWLFVSGGLFGLEHTGYIFFFVEYQWELWGTPLVRTLNSLWLLPAALSLPLAAMGWLALLWPPLNHSLSLQTLLPSALGSGSSRGTLGGTHS